MLSLFGPKSHLVNPLTGSDIGQHERPIPIRSAVAVVTHFVVVIWVLGGTAAIGASSEPVEWPSGRWVMADVIEPRQYENGPGAVSVRTARSPPSWNANRSPAPRAG